MPPEIRAGIGPSSAHDAGLFHPAVGFGQREQTDARTRKFTGDGTPYLPVPGLKTLEGVRVGAMEIPLTETRSYPTSAIENLTHRETREHQMVAFFLADDGVSILQRSILSNNGIWQKEEAIYVRGEWADDAAKDAEKDAPSRMKTQKDSHASAAGDGVTGGR